MTKNLPPAEVLIKRLDHELTTAFLQLNGGNTLGVEIALGSAKKILAQLQEAMK